MIKWYCNQLWEAFLYIYLKLKVNTISVPIANHDNNQHAENENIRLQNLFDGIETMGSLMLMEAYVVD
jgi:hypothetical protein